MTMFLLEQVHTESAFFSFGIFISAWLCLSCSAGLHLFLLNTFSGTTQLLLPFSRLACVVWFPSSPCWGPSLPIMHQGSHIGLTQRSPEISTVRMWSWWQGEDRVRLWKYPARSRRNVNGKHLLRDAFYSVYIIILTEVNCILIVAGWKTTSYMYKVYNQLNQLLIPGQFHLTVLGECK